MRASLVFVLLIAACSTTPAPDPVKPAPQPAKKTVLVLAFDDRSDFGRERFGAVASDAVLAALTDSGRFRMVDRAQGARVLDEMKRAQGGVGEPDAAKAGSLLGADYVVFGVVTGVGMRVESERTTEGATKSQIAECRLTVKIVESATGALAGVFPGVGTAKRSATEPARMSFDPGLAPESVTAAVANVRDRIFEALQR